MRRYEERAADARCAPDAEKPGAPTIARSISLAVVANGGKAMDETRATQDVAVASALKPAADPRAVARRALRASLLKIAALVAVLGGKFVVCRTTEIECRTAARELSTGIAVLVCQAEYVRTGEPATGAYLAGVLRRAGNTQAAAALANDLLATSARGDALQTLGRIALTDNRLDAAISALERARQIHLAERRFDQLAIDDQTLAGIFIRQARFADALRALEDCITEGRQARDAVSEGYCHVSAGQALWRLGHFDGARRELERAQALLRGDRDLAVLERHLGDLEQEIWRKPVRQGHHALAIGHFKKALEHAARAKLTHEAVTIELNLAYSFAQLDRPDEAMHHIDAARAMDPEDQRASLRKAIEAQVAYARGDLRAAAALGEAADEDPKLLDDDRMDIYAMQARIALADNDLERAEMWANRGVDIVERIRQAQVLELRPWVLSSRRASYELLFATLARAGRFEDALMVFDQLQGRTLLDAMSRANPTAALDLRGAAAHAETLRALLPALSNAPLAATGDRRAIFGALASVDLLALVVADGDVWCVTASQGRLAIANIGKIAELRPSFRQLAATPGDVALAERLGALILRDRMFRATSSALRVILDGPVSTLPVAALRRGGQPLIAVRPIVRAPRLSQLGCAPAAPPRRTVVIADARGDLPAARLEAQDLARSRGTTAALGPDATTGALFAVRPDDALHVAVHADVGAAGGYLALYDQPVSALEIGARGLGPSLVVLAACDSAIAEDDDVELATSLPTAFLASGSNQVVATLRPVSDPGAREIVGQFYRRGGLGDPVRALAKIQAALASSSNLDWASFVVFGRDTCVKED
jgi:pentatricopeptide repeat protein